MSDKHTPAPWFVQPDDEALGIYYLSNNGDAPTQQEEAANARLIAAAPELLEALKRVVCCAHTAAHLLRDSAPEEAALFAKDAAYAHAAIAKATES